MIQESCTSIEWISEISKTKKADKGLVQKLIRALILLEGLSESNLGFVFKGGTALMLLLNSTKRLSIDIDIILSEQVENLQALLSEIASKKGFTRAEEQHRSANSGIEKAHYKFYFQNSLKTNEEDFVLLDILFENIHYNHLIATKIQSDFVTQDGESFISAKLVFFYPSTSKKEIAKVFEMPCLLLLLLLFRTLMDH